MLNETWLRIRSLFRRSQLDRDLEDEIAFHLAKKAESLRDRDGAARRFGNATRVKEDLREAWSFPRLESVWQDVRHAARGIRRSPGFAVVAVLSLAIGIGANTSIFTVLNALFLRSLPVRQPEQLRILNWTAKGKVAARGTSGYGSMAKGVRTNSSFSWTAFQELEKLNVFESVGGLARMTSNIVAPTGAQTASVEIVSSHYFQTLGVQAALGRTLAASDYKASAPHVAVISWSFHQRAFGGNPAVLGRSIHVDRTPYTIVGVMPPSFFGLAAATPRDLFVPITRAGELSEYYQLEKPDIWWIQVFARLAPGVSDAQAKAAVDLTLSQITTAEAERRGEKLQAPQALLIDGRTGLAFLNRSTREFLVTLMTMVGLVLLIACANVANLLLARGTARTRELAVRQSLGAGRFRVIRHLLTEAVLIAGAGGLLGLCLASAGSAALTAMIFPDPDANITVTPDGTVFAFSLALTLLTALVFGVMPALRSSKVEPVSCLKAAGAGAGALRQPVTRTLVVVQVATALVLVCGAGLFGRTLINLARMDYGFRPEGLLLFHVDAKRNGYRDQRLIDAYRNITDKVAAIPGVRAATLSESALLSGTMSNEDVIIAGYQKKPGEYIAPYVHVVGPAFLTVMGTPILLGRDIADTDTENSPRVAVVNSVFARKYLDGNPIGREFAAGDTFVNPIRIVGVAADSKYDSVRREVPATIYLPYAQRAQSLHGMTYELRTAVDPMSIAGAVRRAVADIDPTLPVSRIQTQEQQIDRTLSRERSFAVLATFFSVVAVVLACIGVYGVLAYAVTRRTSEFGIRLALGATAGNIRWLVLRGTLVLIAIAMLTGVPVALWATKFIKSQLFGIEAADPATFAGATLAIVVCALAAAWIPGRRAAKCDPTVALRYE